MYDRPLRDPWPGRDTITLREFCFYASVSERVARRLIRIGKLRASRVGRQWRLSRAEAFRILQLEDPGGPPPAVSTPRRVPLAPDEATTLRRFLARG